MGAGIVVAKRGMKSGATALAALVVSWTGGVSAQAPAQPAASSPGADATAPSSTLPLGPTPATERAAPSAIEAEVGEVVVTGTRTPRTRLEAPIRTDVIGPVILERAAPRNLADALDYLPGARSENNCQNCNTTEVQLLGLPGAYNQILLDGLPLMTGVAAVYGVEQVPAVLVNRIEALKGGGSALYGPGAVAGVVNVIPLRPERNGVRATLNYDAPDGSSAVSTAVLASRLLPNDRGFVNLFAQGEYSPDVDLNGDGYSELTRRQLINAGMRGEWRPTDRTILAFDYQYTDERRRGGNLLDRRWDLSNITEAINSQVHRGSLSLSQQLDDATRVVGVYAFADFHRRAYYGGLGDVNATPGSPGFDQAAFDAAAADSRNQYSRTSDIFQFGEGRIETTRGPHALLAGVQYRHEDVLDRGVDVDDRFLGTLTDETFSTLGGFVQDEWTLNGGLRLILGGRLDKSSELDEVIVSPRFGVWASPTRSLVLRANYSTGYRAPEVFSEDIHVDVLGADPIRTRNAPGLKPERADSYAVGFDWRPAWNDGALTLDGQAYYTTLTDTYFLGDILDAGGGALYRQRINASGSRVLGGELNLGYRLLPTLRVLASGVYLDARYDDPQEVYAEDSNVLTIRDYLKSPRWTGLGQVIWDATPNLNVFAAFRYIGSMDVLNNRLGVINRTPEFWVLDVSATRHFALPGGGGREVDLTLGIKNVGDDRQNDLEVGATRDNDYVYGPRLPRTFFLRVSAAF